MDQSFRDKNRVVIWNPKAGTTPDAIHIRKELESSANFHETSGPDDAKRLAAEAIKEGTEFIIVAGGDGTVHSVVNGIGAKSNPPVLAILPLGTGNDLCRTLGVPLNPLEALAVINEQRTRKIDLVEVATPHENRFLVNVASGGNSNRVLECLNDDMKKNWGPWCYLRGAVSILSDLDSYDLRIQIDDGPVEQFQAWNVVLANGRTVAGGVQVSPYGNIEDGQLDVIIVLNGEPLDIPRLTVEFFMGDYLSDERIVYRKARRLKLESHPASKFIVDGEAVSGQPMEFQVLPQVLPVVVGPDYQPECERVAELHQEF